MDLRAIRAITDDHCTKQITERAKDTVKDYTLTSPPSPSPFYGFLNVRCCCCCCHELIVFNIHGDFVLN